MPHGAAHIAQDQVDELAGGGGKAQDAPLVIHKNSGDAAARQQVVHIVIGPGKIVDLGLQLSVDGAQFLVDRLQFFLGSFQFLVGGLQFFVHGLHFLVGGFQLFVGGFQFLIGGLEVFLLGPQLLLEGGNVGLGIWIGVVVIGGG